LKINIAIILILVAVGCTKKQEAFPSACSDLNEKLKSILANIEAGYSKEGKLAESKDYIKEIGEITPKLEKVTSEYPQCKDTLDKTVMVVVAKLTAIQTEPPPIFPKPSVAS